MRGSIGGADGIAGAKGSTLLAASTEVTEVTLEDSGLSGAVFRASACATGCTVVTGPEACVVISRVPGCAFVDVRDAHALLMQASVVTSIGTKCGRFNIGILRRARDRILCVYATRNPPKKGFVHEDNRGHEFHVVRYRS